MGKIDKKKLFGFIFVSLSAVMLMYILLNNNELPQVIEAFKSIKLGYIWIALASIFAFWLLEAFMIFSLIVKFTDKKATFNTFWLAIKTTMIGQYYSNITPFASGGQPVQLYIMKDEKIPLSEATAVLVSKFLLFQIGVTIYSLILVIFRLKSLVDYISGVSFFVFTGLTLNVVMLSVIVLVSFRPKVIITLAEIIFEFLHRHRIIKDLDAVMNKTQSFISEYEVSINKLKENKLYTVKMFLITFIQLTLFFSITVFIYKALNLHGTGIIEIICLQAFLYMAVSFIPTPGTAGVSEVGFVLILGNVFSPNIVGTALLLWRGISYYFSLVFSGVFSLLVTTLSRKKRAVITGSNCA